MYQTGRHKKRHCLTAEMLFGFFVLIFSLSLTGCGSDKAKKNNLYMYEGMSELTPEEAEALARKEAAKEALAGLGDQESLAGLASDGKWVMDEPADQGWSLSQAAPFFMRIRFDRSNEMLMEDQTGMWRRTYKGNYLWDTDAVYEYVRGLQAKYDSEPGKVTFTTHDGRQLLFDSPNCGWHMDVDQTVQALKAAAEAGEEVMDPVWSSGLVYCASNGVGKKYVEVDIPSQKVFLFEDDRLVLETDCVTGQKGVSETTPGVYQVMYKASPSVLKDEDIYGNKYEQPVEYWISFNYSQGMHDALWRYDFGRDIYLTYGSHGCVNLPLDAAKTIYEEVYNYYPVVVYDETIPGVDSPPALSQMPSQMPAQPETEPDSTGASGTVTFAGLPDGTLKG